MKHLIKLFTILATLVTAQTFAGSGKAILPHWGSNTTSQATFVHLSNITDNNVSVKITIYDKDGTVLAPSTYTNFSNGDSEIAAKSSAYISIRSSSWDYGFALIEWENLADHDNAIALVGHAYRVDHNTSTARSNSAIPLNNGLPF